jgi:S1-C subfamily serine protease
MKRAAPPLVVLLAAVLTSALPARANDVAASAAEEVGAPEVAEGSAPQAAERALTGLQSLAQKIGPSVVRLAVIGSEGERGNGTGFIIDESGVLVTNHHVVHRAGGEMYAVFRDGTKVAVLGSLALDKEHDLALLKIDRHGGPALSIAPSSSIHVGQEVLLVGSSFGFDQSLGVGIVSALRPDGYPEEYKKRMKKMRREIGEGPLLQHTVTAAPGASGSPIVDREGRVVAVHHSGFGDSEINFAAHADALTALLARTDLSAAPRPVGRDLKKNLLISAGVFGGLALLAFAVPKAAAARGRRRKRVLH